VRLNPIMAVIVMTGPYNPLDVTTFSLVDDYGSNFKTSINNSDLQEDIYRHT
jgi:hypothetical protein